MIEKLRIRMHATIDRASKPLLGGFFSFSLVHPANVLFVLSAVIHVSLWLIVFFSLGIGDNTIVLQYNAYFGINLIGLAWQAFLLPFVALVFFVVNTVLGLLFFSRGEVFLSTLIFVSLFLVQCAVAIAITALIMVN